MCVCVCVRVCVCVHACMRERECNCITYQSFLSLHTVGDLCDPLKLHCEPLGLYISSKLTHSMPSLTPKPETKA